MSAAVWSVRHEGSPQSRDGLTPEEVLEGVQEGLWEPTDEVRGPGDAGWRPIETHPHFEAALAEYEPPRRAEPPDESRLDFNPLIDVALVLLVFFMLTTAYEMLRKTLNMPGGSAQDPTKIVKIKDVEATTVIVKAAKGDGGADVIRVDDEVVPADKLVEAIRKAAGSKKLPRVLIDAKGVPWGTVVAIMDAANEAKMEKVLLAVPKKKN
jgi:biopolymer transport protein ExbD